ncbi:MULTISPECIES: sensor histidine kinase [unclassified Arthrobacter]|uniref:sensor histidine kinase n=1 Tax=unclassified Arthrobacter TaxID=235627 RepID=UPI0011B0C279|nr:MULTISPECIES: histidine kinase [unclassified Arthrobacter]
MRRKLAQLLRRLGSGDQEPETVGMYLLLTSVLHLANLVNPPLAGFAALAGWWFPVLALGTAPLFLRRRMPTLCALWLLLFAALLLAMGSIGGYFLLFESVFTIYLLAGAPVRRWTLIVLSLVTLTVAGYIWAKTGSTSDAVLAIFIAGFVFFTPMLWAENVRTAKELAHSESARAAAVGAAAADREELLVAEHRASNIEERTALAREMHDVLSARLSSIALLSGALLEREPVTSRPDLRAPLESIRAESVAGLQEMTSMVRMLHAGSSSALRADLSGLPELVQSFQQAGQRIRYDTGVDSDLALVAEQTQTAIYRTVRELLVNHAKHAPGSALHLELLQAPAALVVQSSNPLRDAPDSAGAPSAGGAGSGLNNIRARVQALGGHCEFGSGSTFWTRCEFPTVPEIQQGSRMR